MGWGTQATVKLEASNLLVTYIAQAPPCCESEHYDIAEKR